MISKLKLTISLVVLGAFLLLGIALWGTRVKLKKAEQDRDRYHGNSEVLMKAKEEYMTKDSLMAVSKSELVLELDEYKAYRQDDYNTIKSLKLDIARIKTVHAVQLKQAYELSSPVRDSIVYKDGRVDTLRYISYRNKWIDFEGSIKHNKFTGNIETRDSILVVDHIVPKKFLFFKWGVKSRKTEVVSKNPYTKIMGFEYILFKE